MHKDTITAIIIGFFLGISSAVGILYAPTIFKSVSPRGNTAKPQTQELAAISPTVAAVEGVTSSLTITSPTPNSLVETKSVKVQGTAKAAKVVLDTPRESWLLALSDDGSFSQTVALKEGVNTFTFTVYQDNAQVSETQSLKVFYTTESL